MRGLPAFFVLGSVGLVITAVLHILIASLTGSAGVAIWAPIYTVCIVFLGLGFSQIMRRAGRDV